MKAIKRAALKLMMKRYTTAKNVSRESAIAALVGEGIYTNEGNLSPQYGGKEGSKKVVSARK